MIRTAGILAHVDAGKTTLSEALLYNSGVIKSQGRVDTKDAFLDTDAVEKERGITIYSKNARLPIMGGRHQLILLDTPGHVDFSAEMERAINVLDFAVLLISASSGIQAHTKTVWKLLSQYHVPTVIFVNKMDMPDTDKNQIIDGLKSGLSSDIVDFTENQEKLFDDIATCSETVMEEYLENGEISDASIHSAIFERRLFPCFFGSALKNTGIDVFINGLEKYLFGTEERDIKGEFGARVYKISRDEKGNRLTFVKITSGELRVKSVINDEKINEIRLYNGSRYESVQGVSVGELCALVGMTGTKAGEALGKERDSLLPLLEPVMSYVLNTKDKVDKLRLLSMAKEIEEEDPSLHVAYEEQTKEISVMLMGDVQTEVLKRVFYDRFKVEIYFSEGKVCYKETITKPVEGVGHFEPLRHYAEAHIKMEPLERGSGIEVDSDVSEDLLDRNWQRLIMTHILEKRHRGVLVRGEITDIRFTVVGGKAHIKHTEGGDFRQATYRAVRQGLMQLRSEGCLMLLEPFYDFTLEIPEEYVGRAMTDVAAMNGNCEISENDPKSHVTVLNGRGPVSKLNGYAKIVYAYTKGQGRIFFRNAGYGECHNEEEVLEASIYDPEADLLNPSGSVFCSHGAGVIIPWNQVADYMHVPFSDDKKGMSELFDLSDEEMIKKAQIRKDVLRRQSNADSGNEAGSISIGTEEIDRIIKSTAFSNAKGRSGAYKGISADRHENRRDERSEARKLAEKNAANGKETVYKGTKSKEKYLLVDGYNVIHAWSDLAALSEQSLDGAVGSLIDRMCNYQAMCGQNLMVVFDAYRVKGHGLEIKKHANITVVFTKEAQTADAYIERYAHENSKKYDITVVTSDGVEQVIVSGKGCNVISSREFELLTRQAGEEFNKLHGVK